jgi:hypothetical protein
MMNLMRMRKRRKAVMMHHLVARAKKALKGRPLERRVY